MWYWKHIRQYSGAILAIAALAIASFQQIGGYDVWWHIANGQKYLSQFPYIFADTFSYTHPGHKVAANAFLGDILLYGLYQFGEPGVVIGWSIIHALTIFVIYHICRSLGNTPAMAIWLCLWAYLVLRTKYTFRPESIAYLGFATITWMLIEARRKKQIALMWGQVGIFWLWGMFTSSAIFGLPMAALLVAEYAWQHREHLRVAVLAFGASCLAALLNPAGLVTLKWFTSSDLAVARLHITEYATLSWELLRGPLIALLLYGVWGLSVVILSWRKGFWWRPLTLVLPWMAWGLYGSGVRVIPFLVLATTPWIAAASARWQPPSWVEQWTRWVVPVVGAVLIFGAGVSFSENYGLTRRLDAYPERVRSMLDRYNLNGPLLAPFPYGGYFIHFRQGKTKVAADGRNTTAYPSDYMLDFYALSHDAVRFDAHLRRYPTDLIMIHYDNISKNWLHVLQRPDFVMVHWDKHYALLVRRTSPYLAHIPYRYRRLSLVDPLNQILNQIRRADTVVLQEILDDLRLALKQDAQNPMAQYLWQFATRHAKLQPR